MQIIGATRIDLAQIRRLSGGVCIRYSDQKAPASVNRKYLLLLVVALALVLAAGVTAWAMVFRPVAVHIARVEHDVPVQVFGLGTVEARVTSRVGFKVSGVLVELKADVGDRVDKGAVLARLDDREQRAQVARAKAAIEQTEANLQRAKASVEKAQANSANAARISEPPAKAGSDQLRLGRGGGNGQDDARRGARGSEPGE